MNKIILLALAIFAIHSEAYEEKIDAAVACAKNIKEFKNYCGNLRVESAERRDGIDVRDSSASCGTEGPNAHVRVILTTTGYKNTCQVIETRRDGQKRVTRYSDHDALVKTVIYTDKEGGLLSRHYYGPENLLSFNKDSCSLVTKSTGYIQEIPCPDSQFTNNFIASGNFPQNNNNSIGEYTGKGTTTY